MPEQNVGMQVKLVKARAAGFILCLRLEAMERQLTALKRRVADAEAVHEKLAN